MGKKWVWLIKIVRREDWKGEEWGPGGKKIFHERREEIGLL